MATLSKHGTELGRIEMLTCKVAYFSDGKILRNQGDGWKLYRKVKPGVDPKSHFDNKLQASKQFLIERPAFAEFKRQLHSVASFTNRYMVKSVLDMLSNDPDGVWSELNDMLHIPCDIEEIVSLCHAYDASVQEANAAKSIAATTIA